MPDRSPRDGERCEVGTVRERLEDKTVSLRSVEAVHPHAPDFGGHLGEVVADAHGPLEGSEWVAIDSGACRAVDELV